MLRRTSDFDANFPPPPLFTSIWTPRGGTTPSFASVRLYFDTESSPPYPRRKELLSSASVTSILTLTTLPHVLLSSTIAMASRVQLTFTEAYADYVQLQEEYARKCAEYDHIDCTLSSVLPQIEGQYLFFSPPFNILNQMRQAPILSQQHTKYERLQAAQHGSQMRPPMLKREGLLLLQIPSHWIRPLAYHHHPGSARGSNNNTNNDHGDEGSKLTVMLFLKRNMLSSVM